MSPFGRHIAATVQPIKSTLLALFFLSVGLPVDLRIVSLTLAPLLLYAAAILLMKSAVVFGLALALGVPGRMRYDWRSRCRSAANSASSCSARHRRAD
jgi:Kef-type K+ transport system membrane component KefB